MDRDMTSAEQDTLELQRMQELAAQAGELFESAKNAARDAFAAHRPHDARIHRNRARSFARAGLAVLEEV